MALSPWHVASRLSFDDVAALLAGFDISLAKTGNVHDHEIKEYEEWCRVIVRAAKHGDLKPWIVEVLEEEVVEDPASEGYFINSVEWQYRAVDDASWQWHDENKIRLVLERQEVYRWLKASGVADNDIPEALRVMPQSQAPAAQRDKPLHHRRRQTYLTLIEALALEAMGGEIPDEPYKAAGILQAVLERHALKLDKDPIADTVKEIQAAREDRSSEKA